MKKSIAIFAVLCLLFCLLIGCTAESPGTTTTTPSTTTTTPATPVQDDNGPGIGGVDGNWYFSSDWHDNSALDSCVAELVDQKVYTKWANEFIAPNNKSGTRSQEENKAWIFIREMKIPREKIEELCEWYLDVLPGYGQLYTDGQIEAIYNGTEEDIVREFASPYAIVIGTKIYSPKWLYEHTVEEYVAEGISFDLFRSRLPYILIACDTDDNSSVLLSRYDEFRRLQEPSYAGKIANAAAKVTASGKEYAAPWFVEHTAEEYRAAGITYDLLSESIISIVASYSHTGEREDVCERYTALKELETAANSTVK